MLRPPPVASESRALLLQVSGQHVSPVLRSIDTSQSDLFSGAAGAGVSVVATRDVNLF